jgi:hypothetical protein
VDLLVVLGGESSSNQSVASSGNFIVENGGEIRGGHEALASFNGFNIKVDKGGLVTSSGRAVGSEGNGGNIYIADGGRVESTGGINWDHHLIHLESDGRSITIENEANAQIKNGIVSLDDDTTYNKTFIPDLFDSSVKEPHMEVIFGDFSDPEDIPAEYYVKYARGTVNISRGRTFEIRGTLHNNGTLKVYGALKNYGKHTVINENRVEIASGAEVENQGTWKNEGEVENQGTWKNEGEVENQGTWKNENGGQVVNNGIFKSNQTADEMGGGFSGNDIQPLEPGNPGGSGGGCATGLSFGLLPLIIGGLVLSRKKNG